MSETAQESLAPGSRQATFRWGDHRIDVRQTPLVRYLWLFKKTELLVDGEVIASSESALSFGSDEGEGTFTDSRGEPHRVVFETGSEFRTLGGPVTVWLDGELFYDGTVGTSVATVVWGAFLGVGLGLLASRGLHALF